MIAAQPPTIKYVAKRNAAILTLLCAYAKLPTALYGLHVIVWMGTGWTGFPFGGMR